MKIWKTLVIREMYIKTISYHNTYIRMAKISKIFIPSKGKDVNQLKLS